MAWCSCGLVHLAECAEVFVSGGDVFGVDQGAVLACDEMCADEDAVYAGFGD